VNHTREELTITPDNTFGIVAVNCLRRQLDHLGPASTLTIEVRQVVEWIESQPVLRTPR
jgi:hypothetical protein